MVIAIPPTPNQIIKNSAAASKVYLSILLAKLKFLNFNENMGISEINKKQNAGTKAKRSH